MDIPLKIKKKPKHNPAGFTLIELVLVIVLIGIMVGLSAPFISTMIDAWMCNRTERDLVFNARLALNRLVREMRMANNITGFNSSFINFTDVFNNSISFYQSGSCLYRNNNELSSKLDSLNGLDFTYLDINATPTSNVTNIRMVRLKLNLTEEDSSIALESLVKFRNME